MASSIGKKPCASTTVLTLVARAFQHSCPSDVDLSPEAIREQTMRPGGNAVVGVLHAAMDEELGVHLAELHVARPGHASERLRVRTGQSLLLDGATNAVDGIWPWNGRSPAGVVLRPVVAGAEVGDGLG